MSSYIQLTDVSKSYRVGQVVIPAAHEISFQIEKGELAVIVGPSGAGKTTVLNLLGGIDTCDSGSLMVDSLEVSKLTHRELISYRRFDIGFVFQYYNLVQNLTALENVELASEICSDSLPAEDVLELVGLSHRLGNFPAQLSGGEQQRVSIARAIAKNPKILLCDEPTGALDYNTGKEVLKLLSNTCRETGMTVALITHNQAITPIANRVISIRNGRVAATVINDRPVPVEQIEW